MPRSASTGMSNKIPFTFRRSSALPTTQSTFHSENVQYIHDKNLRFHTGPTNQRLLSSKLSPPEMIHSIIQTFTSEPLNGKNYTPPLFGSSEISLGESKKFAFANGIVYLEKINEYKIKCTWSDENPDKQNKGPMDTFIKSFRRNSIDAWFGRHSEHEIKFMIEVCRLRNLPGLYIFDFKRLKGDHELYRKLYTKVLDRLVLDDFPITTIPEE